MNLFKSKWLLILLIPAIGFLGLSLIKIKLQENIVNEELGDLERKIGDLEKSNGLLEKFISMMNNPAFIEKEARLRLNYKAPDENVVFVYPDTGARASVSAESQLANMPNYVKWFYYLLGY